MEHLLQNWMLGQFQMAAAGLYTNLCSTQTLQSDKKGFFLDFAEHVANTAGNAWLSQQFGILKTDRDRVRCVFENVQVKRNVCEMLERVQQFYRPKSAAVSRDRRIHGEKILNNEQDPRKALMLFGQAVLRAPPTGVDLLVDGGLSYPLALWSRSEVLVYLQEYSLALVDLQLALKEGLPAKHKAQLYWRMAKCYTGINEPKKAQVALGLTIQLLGDDEHKKALLEEDIKSVIPINSEKKKTYEPKVQGPKHKTLKNASRSISIAETSALGRHAIAKTEIPSGETLVVEEPYAACLMPEYFGSHCYHCFKRVFSPVGCPECSAVAFCSAACKDAAANTYHKYECRILDFLIGSGMSVLCHLALRMITKHSLSDALEIYASKSKRQVYRLCTLAPKRAHDDFLNRTLMAAFLLRCLQKVDYFPDRTNNDQVDPTEDEFKIAELLLMHLQILQFNAHEITELRHTSEVNPSKTKDVSIAIAVYPTASLFNHDCYPSVTRYFAGNKIVITTNRPVEAGEIISENYGIIFTRFPRAERQRALESRYWFTCTCQACSENWPQISQVDDSVARLRCVTPKCTGLFILPDIGGKCSKCGVDVMLDESLVKLNECENQYRQAANFMDDGDYGDAIRTYAEALGVFHGIAVPPHKETHRSQDRLKTCLTLASNVL